jgi:AraC family transcriptional regulator
VPIGAYVRRLRLDWAASRLKMADEPIARIGLEAGFADQSHFTRAFKRYTGLTPAEYRSAFEALSPGS